MEQYADVIIDPQGNVVVGAMVSILDSQGAPAQIFGSNNQNSSINNPILTGSLGEFSFFARNGRYRIGNVSVGGRVFQVGYREFILNDPDDGAGGLPGRVGTLESNVAQLDIEAEATTQALDALQLPDYAALRAYKGPRKSVYVTGAGIAGMFVRDDTDTASADNGGTVIVANGKRWKRDTGAAVNINWFFLAGEANHTGMFSRAMAAARRVYAPAGTYMLDSAVIPSDTEIFGDGDNTVLLMSAASLGLFSVNSGSADVANNIKNIHIHNVQMRATVDVDGFSEHRHMVRLNGVSNVLFKHVLFKGFRGDAVYIGSGDGGGQERHNENVVIKRCRFDGINNDNRNAVSFIDIDGALVEGCKFQNCTRANMPGPIDLEPNAYSFGIIKNVTIRRNVFKGNGGNAGEISVFVPAAVTAAPANITVENNVSTGYIGSASFFLLRTDRVITATSEDNNIKLLYNRASGGYRPYNLVHGKRVTILGNLWSDFAREPIIGYNSEGTGVWDVTVENDRYLRVGTVGGKGTFVGIAKYVRFKNVKWIDCGTGAAGDAAVSFGASSTSSYVSFDGCEFSSPTGKTLLAIQKEATHTLTASTNKFVNNEVNGLSIQAFAAEDSDVIATSWTPIVEGATSAGVGTYTSQVGVFSRRGKLVTATGSIAVTSHTGTGLLEISVPVPAGNSNTGALIPIGSVSMSGLTFTGVPAAMLNKDASADGKFGAIRIYYSQSAGAQGQVNVPVGAFTIQFSVTYRAT